MNLCRIYLLAFVYQLTTIATLAALPHTKCVRTYTKLGCFQSNNEPLTEFLISDRGPGTDGHKLNWKEWEESIHSLACRCAEAARKREASKCLDCRTMENVGVGLVQKKHITSMILQANAS
ncbi:hypothetical protein OS493_028603 [Desmophyllum pertusum]|uniref:Secreted protein n=1 Tax=Desmophyllum pertusum TaxID=174260 RepID=A0A9W9YX44_9CNID|nr:hypothetical protein OS493_028603 [Desmophyllum pertusum]